MSTFLEYSGLSILRLTKGAIPAIDFLSLKNYTLGKKYKLSLVFATPKLSAELNSKWKGKTGPADILSFPLSENEGEIFISLSRARQKAPEFERSYLNFLQFLFIHGMVHLKGYEHGSTMEAVEEKIRKHFGV